jgi:enterochelin esterase-like enzyme
MHAQRSTQENSRARSNTANASRLKALFNRQSRFGKALSIFALFLIGLLIFDVVFVVLYTAAPREAAADMRSAAIEIVYIKPTGSVAPALAAALAATPIAQPTPAPLKPRPIYSTSIGQAAKPAPTIAPTKVAPPVTSFAQAQIAEAQIGAAAAPSCPSPVGRIVTETVRSKVTAAPITVHVYVPPCYNDREYAYPTLYLIHGTAYEQGGWIANGLPRIADLQMSIGMLPPFIIVMPGADMRAGEASTYSWSNWGKGSYEDFFMNELVPFIEDKYSTWGTREGRAIGGISRGGYWSIEIGFANPDKFSFVGGHSPSVYTQLVNMPANFSMLDTAKSIGMLHTLRIWLDAGSEDWAKADAKKLAHDLDGAGVSYRLDIGEGGHVDEYWSSRIPEYLAFYSSTWPRAARSKQTLGFAPYN